MRTKSKSSTSTDNLAFDTQAARDSVSLTRGDTIPLETVGDTLRLDFLEPAGITAYRLAKEIGVPQTYISKVLHGASIGPELGLLLDRYFGLSDGWWGRLQAAYDARKAKARIADKLERITPYRPAA